MSMLLCHIHNNKQPSKQSVEAASTISTRHTRSTSRRSCVRAKRRVNRPPPPKTQHKLSHASHARESHTEATDITAASKASSAFNREKAQRLIDDENDDDDGSSIRNEDGGRDDDDDDDDNDDDVFHKTTFYISLLACNPKVCVRSFVRTKPKSAKTHLQNLVPKTRTGRQPPASLTQTSTTRVFVFFPELLHPTVATRISIALQLLNTNVRYTKTYSFRHKITTNDGHTMKLANSMGMKMR